MISLQDAAVLSTRLSAFMADDSYGDGKDGYEVLSLYFDTPARQFARDKEDGLFERKKYRLRTYGSTGVYKFEQKEKKGSLCFKTSCTVNPDTARALRDGGLSVHSRENGFLASFAARRNAGLLSPSVGVSYSRRAFCLESGHVRVTLDGNVRALRPAGAFAVSGDVAKAPFSPSERPLALPVLTRGFAILEVKYTGFLPAPVRFLLSLPGRPIQSLSKYVLALDALSALRQYR